MKEETLPHPQKTSFNKKKTRNIIHNKNPIKQKENENSL